MYTRRGVRKPWFDRVASRKKKLKRVVFKWDFCFDIKTKVVHDSVSLRKNFKNLDASDLVRVARMIKLYENLICKTDGV